MGTKLIRDKIPEIARVKGEEMVCHVANPAEYRYYLREKLPEEVEEFLNASEAKATEELADILEVVRAIAAERGLSMRKLYSLRDKKRKERGGFEGRIIYNDGQDVRYGGT